MGILENLRPKDAVPFRYPSPLSQLRYRVDPAGRRSSASLSNVNCSSVRREQLEHFTSRYAMNIEGVGKETIEELIAAGLVVTPAIFSL